MPIIDNGPHLTHCLSCMFLCVLSIMSFMCMFFFGQVCLAKKCSTYCEKRQKIIFSSITFFGPTVPSQISADLDVGRRPTDDCAEICEGTLGRSPPICEKGPAASPGKLQPLPPLSSPAHPQANEATVTQRAQASSSGGSMQRSNARPPRPQPPPCSRTSEPSFKLGFWHQL
mgnify:CR=1 FL=1